MDNETRRKRFVNALDDALESHASRDGFEIRNNMRAAVLLYYDEDTTENDLEAQSDPKELDRYGTTHREYEGGSPGYRRHDTVPNPSDQRAESLHSPTCWCTLGQGRPPGPPPPPRPRTKDFA